MYKRILVAVDDSETSTLAMQEAIQLAKDQHAKLCIIYVADEFIEAGEGVAVDFKKHEAKMRKLGKSILKKMVSLAKKAKISVENHLVEIIHSNDRIANKIVDEAKDWDADLIVLGTHGRTGLSRLLLGSVAEEVVRNTSIPVHLVRKPQ